MAHMVVEIEEGFLENAAREVMEELEKDPTLSTVTACHRVLFQKKYYEREERLRVMKPLFEQVRRMICESSLSHKAETQKTVAPAA